MRRRREIGAVGLDQDALQGGRGEYLAQRRRFRERGGGVVILTEIAVWLFACVAIMFGFAQIGFVVVAPIIIATAMLASGERRWWLILIIAASVTAATVLGADTIFDVELP